MFVTKLAVFCVGFFTEKMEILQEIDRLQAELNALRPLDREREGRVMQKLQLDWNFHSNHLEGNSLTYGETKALILFGITAQGKPLKDHIEMTEHDEAIKWVEELIKEQRPLTEKFIRELHELLLKKPYQVDAITPDGKPTKKWVKVGEYKTTPNNVITVTGEPFYFATPEETPAMMTDLIEWYRTEQEKKELHPLQLAALFHYKFVRIHPFDDGNGRTARILMNFILMQHGLPPVIIKTEDKKSHFAALRQADAGLLEPFTEYIGENLVWSLELMIRGAKGENIEDFEDLFKESWVLKEKLDFRSKQLKESIKELEILREKKSEDSEAVKILTGASKKMTDISKVLKEFSASIPKIKKGIKAVERFIEIYNKIKAKHPNEKEEDILKLASKEEIAEMWQIALESKDKALLDILQDSLGEITDVE